MRSVVHLNRRPVVLASVALAFAGSLLQTAAAAEPYRWEKTPESISLTSGEHIIWRFNFGARETKPCFHPVSLPGRPSLTWYRPGDHKWHCGLWFSWKYLNGVNYWEEDPNRPASAGETSWSNVQAHTNPDGSARIELAVSYKPASQETPVLTEKRVIHVSAPDASGQYSFDWDSIFTAGKTNVLLDRTPLPHEPEGKVYGGYAGLSIRFVKDLMDVVAVTSAYEQPLTFEQNRFRGKATALDYSGKLDGIEMGIATLDHADNLNSPSPWYVINDPVMRFYTPAVLCYGPHTLKAGESFRLRYRTIVHPGRMNSDRLRKLASEFANSAY